MSQTQDVFRKIGRGGAGNFYSKPAVPDNTNKDLEAQHPDPSTQPLPSSNTPLPGQYARAGRGGAGNYVDPSTAWEQQAAEEKITAKASANAAAGKAVNRMALGGRGGAGNYSQKTEEVPNWKAETKKSSEIEQTVTEAVNGLKMPPRAVLAGDRK
jgi:hypothetical protein